LRPSHRQDWDLIASISGSAGSIVSIAGSTPTAIVSRLTVSRTMPINWHTERRQDLSLLAAPSPD
jgi:hypothetical protein